MAKQYRKLQKNLYKKPKQKKPTEKIGKDYVLMAVTVFTLLITVAGWTSLDNLSRVMYTLLFDFLALPLLGDIFGYFAYLLILVFNQLADMLHRPHLRR